MAKWTVLAEEYYPFYALDDLGGEKELPEEFVERYKRVMTEFEELQSELRRIADRPARR